MTLQKQIRSCTKCSLCMDMPGTKPVPGIGPTDSNIMLVGEALGEDESILEEPFVGQCGQFLDAVLQEAELERSSLFVSNVVKCRPTRNNGRANRPPTDDEIAACKGWLWKELQDVRPEVVVTLGKIPTYTLLNSVLRKSFTLGKVCGQEFKVEYMDSVIIPLYHPSYIMVHGKDKRQLTVDIFKEIKEKYA